MPAPPPAVRALPRLPIKGDMLPKTRALQFERIIHRDRAAGCGVRAHPFLIAEEDSVRPELLSENPILRQKILESVLLSALDPAGQDQEQQLPWLKLRLHVLPDSGRESGASGIAVFMSSVRDMSQPWHGKALSFS